MDPVTTLIAALSGYLLGAVSFARLVPRLVDPQADLSDIRMPIDGVEEEMPMQAMGANTASMKYGSRVGCTAGLLDMLKVFLPTLLFRLLFPEQPYALVAAAAGFAGHCWPVYYRFKGGRGISAFYGGMFALDPLGALVVSTLSMLIGMVLLKDLLIAYTGGMLLSLPWFWFTTHSPAYVLYAASITVMFVIAILPEVRAIRTLQKKYGREDMYSSMNKFPMGRAMLKLMDALRLRKGRA